MKVRARLSTLDGNSLYRVQHSFRSVTLVSNNTHHSHIDELSFRRSLSTNRAHRQKKDHRYRHHVSVSATGLLTPALFANPTADWVRL